MVGFVQLNFCPVGFMDGWKVPPKQLFKSSLMVDFVYLILKQYNIISMQYNHLLWQDKALTITKTIFSFACIQQYTIVTYNNTDLYD